MSKEQENAVSPRQALQHTLRSDKEDVERDVLILQFKRDLSLLVETVNRRADEVGGYFRGPGIRKSLYDDALTIVHAAFRPTRVRR